LLLEGLLHIKIFLSEFLDPGLVYKIRHVLQVTLRSDEEKNLDVLVLPVKSVQFHLILDVVTTFALGIFGAACDAGRLRDHARR